MAADLYAVLGVTPDATDDEIKKAYRKLARELHPDVNDDAAHQDRFKEITAAYDILSDPEKRQRYDLGVEGGAFGFGGLGDIFEAFFGAGGGLGGFGGARGPRSRVQRGRDSLVRVRLDLADAAFGTTAEVAFDTAVVCAACTGSGCATGTHPETCSQCQGRGEINQVSRSFLGQVMTSRPCAKCNGAGSVIEHPCPACRTAGRVAQRRTVTVQVPAGVDDSMRIRLSGEGETGPGGGPNGDLYVECAVDAHPVFVREGDDLHCQLAIAMTSAALGTNVTLKTLDSEEDIEIRPGTQPASVITLRGRGVPHLRRVGRGDLHVHVDVRTPTDLDDEQERLLRELAQLRNDEDPRGGGPGLFERIRDVLGGR